MPISRPSAELVRAYPLREGGQVDQARRLVKATLASRALGQKASTLASQRTPVLILGETGTGKTMLASELHDASTGSALFTLSCASLGDTQLAEVVCEHLSDAEGTRTSAGTLLLDEIGELSPWGQAVLLRALSTYEALTGPRIVATTHRDLEAMVRSGAFSGELLMRLRGATLSLAPLRERVEEVAPLALHFLRLCLRQARIPFVSLDPMVLCYLEQHSWPGNVRELRNVVGSALTRCTDGLLGVELLPEELRAEASGEGS